MRQKVKQNRAKARRLRREAERELHKPTRLFARESIDTPGPLRNLMALVYSDRFPGRGGDRKKLGIPKT